jgi:hypothetical protein
MMGSARPADGEHAFSNWNNSIIGLFRGMILFELGADVASDPGTN